MISVKDKTDFLWQYIKFDVFLSHKLANNLVVNFELYFIFFLLFFFFLLIAFFLIKFSEVRLHHITYGLQCTLQCTFKDDGILCYKDTGFSKYTLPDHVSIKCLYSGQYVIYYNERRLGVYCGPDYSHKAYADLCELEVYEILF